MEARKIIFHNGQSPGDGVAMSYGIKSLHESFPGQFLTDIRTGYDEIFIGNPFITPLSDNDPNIEHITANYETIHQSNQYPYRFITTFMDYFSDKLGVDIKPSRFQGFIYVEEQEKYWYSAVHEKLGKDVPYWILDAGHKKDFTAKSWEFARYQEVVNRFPELTFVQIGHEDHVHPEMYGDNLINLVGKTDLRQLIRLFYNSFGVITPVSLPMMFAYGIEPHHRFKRLSRACIVLSGGREPNHWQQGPNQQFLHTCGMLDCCDYGGCWKSRTIPLGDNDEKDQSLCLYPTKTVSGQVIPKCMDMISADEVCLNIDKYMNNLNYQEN